MSVLKRCPSYREFNYSKMTEKWQGPTQGVRLREVSVERELTVYSVKILSTIPYFNSGLLYNLFL